MEYRVLIPVQLKLVSTEISKYNDRNNRSKRNSRESGNNEVQKPTSSGIDVDSDNEEKPRVFSSSSDSSSISSERMSTLSPHSDSEDSDFESDSGIPVSSEFVIRNRNEAKSRTKLRRIQQSRDEVKIYASQEIASGLILSSNEGEFQTFSFRGIDSLDPDDIRLVFGCFDRTEQHPENTGNKIRLCNWLRFVRRSFNSFDSRINLVGRFKERKPSLEFTRDISPNEEIVVFFDMGNLKHKCGDLGEGFRFTLTASDNFAEAPLDLSKSPAAGGENKLKPQTYLKSGEDSEDYSTTTVAKFSCQISGRNALQQPMGVKLFQPHLYSPPGSSTSTTNPNLSSPTNSVNSALNSPISSHPLSQHLGILGSAGNVGLLRPILRTRGRERSLLPCSVCGKAFDRPSLLKRHMRTHTGEKPHICDVCNKGFSTSSSLNTHRRIHSGEKPHQCPMCGKRFTASSNLYYHKMTHNKEKPHKCHQCQKSFPTPGDLKSHQYVHSGVWPYNCHHCQRGFSKQTNLRNHILLHSGDKPHICQVCGKGFALACNLRAHLRTHEEDPVSKCLSCKRTFPTSLNMLVNGSCRPCILHLQNSATNNNSNKIGSGSGLKPIKRNEQAENLPLGKIGTLSEEISTPATSLLHSGFHMPHPTYPHQGLFHDSLAFSPNGSFLEQQLEWLRLAKVTFGNYDFMRQKLLESQMLAAQLMGVSNSPGLSDVLRFQTGLSTGDFNGLDGSGINKFVP